MEIVAVYADRSHLTRYFFISAFFTVVAAVMAFDGRAVVGSLCFVVFGAATVVYAARLRSPKPMFELSPAGLRPSSGGMVPWRDVEDVGVGTLGRFNVVGVRLSDYLPYVRSAAENLPKWKQVSISITARLATGQVRPGLEHLSRVEQNLIVLLDWNRRRTGGLDISWIERMLPGSPETVVNQIRGYRDDALKADPR